MFFWMLLACTNPKETESKMPPEWQGWDVLSAGPYQIGHRLLEHSYTPIEGAEARIIMIDVWYPTDDLSGDPGSYLYGFDDRVFEDAVPAAPVYAGGYPVHVHSHGYQGWGASSAFLMRHFASHGWLAVAPNHTGNLLGDHQSPLPTAHYIHRPLDIQEALDQATLLDLPGPVNTTSVVMSGHSFGASYTTWAVSGATYENLSNVCENGEGIEDDAAGCTDQERQIFGSGALADPRVAVAFPMAGTVREAFFGAEGYKGVSSPVMFASGTEDGEARNQAHFDGIDGIDFQWLSLQGGCHQSFATGACSTLDTALGFEILGAMSLAHARQQLLDDDAPEVQSLLSGEALPWEEVSLQRKE